MEEQETVGGKKYHCYTHPEGQPEDALQAFVYSLIVHASTRLRPEFATMDLFGP